MPSDGEESQRGLAICGGVFICSAGMGERVRWFRSWFGGGLFSLVYVLINYIILTKYFIDKSVAYSFTNAICFLD